MRNLSMEKMELRRQSILKFLEQGQMFSVTEMAAHFNVTTETIRRDLSELEKSGLVVKFHGGAILTKKGEPVPYIQREMIHREEKQRIAEAASKLIQEKNILIIEGSTTSTALCQELLKVPVLLKSLTIITNSIRIVELLEFGDLCADLIFLGGRVSAKEQTTYGIITAKNLELIHADYAFLSAATLNHKFHFLTYYERDMIFQQAAIANANKTVFMIDASKFGISGVYDVNDMSSVDYLITDISFSEEDLELLNRKNVAVISVN